MSCVDNLKLVDCKPIIDSVYIEIVNVLKNGANQFVPQCCKHFSKFWWDQDMDLLKDASIESNRIWKAADKLK